MRQPLLLTLSTTVIGLSVLCFSGCSSSGNSVSGKGVPESQGIIGLEVASQTPLEELNMVGPGGVHVSSGFFDKRIGLILFTVNPGRYCLDKAVFHRGKIDLKHYGSDVCFEVVVGAIGYVGHYVFSLDGDRHAMRFDRLSVFRKELYKQYPALSGKYRLIDLLQVHSI